MKLSFTMHRWDIDFTNRSKQPWSHVGIHMHPDIRWYARPKSRLIKLYKGLKDGYVHIVIGRLSLILERWDIERYATCAECGSTQIHETSMGDEGWTHCPDCGSIEGEYRYISKRMYNDEYRYPKGWPIVACLNVYNNPVVSYSKKPNE